MTQRILLISPYNLATFDTRPAILDTGLIAYLRRDGARRAACWYLHPPTMHNSADSATTSPMEHVCLPCFETTM